MFNVLLVPLDGSKRAERILPYVEYLAFARESKIVLLQVIEPDPNLVSAFGVAAYYNTDLAQLTVNEVKSYLDTLACELRGKGLAVEPCVQYGPVVQTILDVAEQKKADLIAMASHGRTGVERAFYGSVAAGVLHQADRPLLLIRADDSQQAKRTMIM
jgi:nucleotide-binding universal stress UspA family protein